MYLLEITEEKNAHGLYRVRLLPGQYLNSEPIDSTLNVQTRLSGLRETGPIGAIVKVHSLELKQTAQGVKYYSTSDNLVIHKD